MDIEIPDTMPDGCQVWDRLIACHFQNYLAYSFSGIWRNRGSDRAGWRGLLR
jgi:hypothetical protein